MLTLKDRLLTQRKGVGNDNKNNKFIQFDKRQGIIKTSSDIIQKEVLNKNIKQVIFHLLSFIVKSGKQSKFMIYYNSK